MTKVTGGVGFGSARPGVARSLEPGDAWIGTDVKASAKRRRPDDTARPRSAKRKGARYAIAALLLGGAGAYAASDGFDFSGRNLEPATPAKVAAAPARTAPPAASHLSDVEGRRRALLEEIAGLETRRTEHQGEVSELADRRANLNDELVELERQRRDWAQKLAGMDKSMPASSASPEVDDAPRDDDGLDAELRPSAGPDAEQVAKLEQDRKEAAAAAQRKDEETRRARELREKKAAAERELAANRRREREAAARAQQEVAAASAQVGPAEDERSSLMSGLFGGPVAGFARQQRSPYVPMPVATRFPASSAAPKRVFVHFSAYDPGGRAKAHAMARRLQSQGFAVAELRPVRTRVRGNTVRYFHEGDRDTAPALRGAVARSLAQDGAPSSAAVQDFRHFDRPPGEGTLEVWLSE